MNRLLTLVLAATAALPVLAADPAGGTPADTAAGTPAGKPPETPWLIPYSDYSGDLWRRAALTGDWGGVRKQWMDNGLRIDASATFAVQGNLAGGVNNRTGTTGKLDLGLQLDTGKAHLWPGGVLKVAGEGRFGTDANTATGALMPVNADAVYPAPGDDEFLLPELNYTQFVAPFLGFTFGKYSLREANVFAHDESDQFMNMAFNFNPVAGTTIPLSTLGVGVVILPTPGLVVMTALLDSEGTARQCGFDTAFQGGTTVMQTIEWTVRPGGLPGHQRLLWTYSDKRRIQFAQSSRVVVGAILNGNTAGLERESSDWCVAYDFDQYMSVVPGSKDRGWGVFGRVGFANDQINPIKAFYSVGLGGKGPWDVRPNDSFGVGVYYLQLSDNLPFPIDRRARDEYGVELYYNLALTPWMHVTADLQVIEPANRGADVTVVGGVRVKVDF